MVLDPCDIGTKKKSPRRKHILQSINPSQLSRIPVETLNIMKIFKSEYYYIFLLDLYD
jgi:hypothetical protein